jgi:hypothetical protein
MHHAQEGLKVSDGLWTCFFVNSCHMRRQKLHTRRGHHYEEGFPGWTDFIICKTTRGFLLILYKLAD